MKKVIIGLTGMVILAVVVILFVNAQSSKAVASKPATEVASKCGACPSAATCPEMKGTTTTATATTAACCDSTKKETATMAACPSAKPGCETACPMKATLSTK
jgi:hypothetical protein